MQSCDGRSQDDNGEKGPQRVRSVRPSNRDLAEGSQGRVMVSRGKGTTVPARSL